MKELLNFIEECGTFSHIKNKTASTGQFELIPLKQAASSRSYYRLRSEAKSLVIMKLPDGEIPVEEGFTGKKLNVSEYPFLTMQKACKRAKLPVPEIYSCCIKQNMLLLEDLGDLSLYEKAIKDAVQAYLLYEKAILTLADFQFRLSSDAELKQTQIWSRKYDAALFLWEFNHFIEYGLRQKELYQGKFQVNEKALSELRLLFEKISELLSKETFYLNHRDYHSQNIMVREESIFLIDFQDALLGPLQYDLASLLRDSYILLKEATVEKLIDLYLDYSREAYGFSTSKDSFIEIFHLTGFQRNLKAWGRFVFIDKVKENSAFLAHIPLTLQQIKRYSDRHPLIKEATSLLLNLSGEYAAA